MSGWTREVIALLKISFPNDSLGNAEIPPLPTAVSIDCSTQDLAHETIHEQFRALQKWTNVVSDLASNIQHHLPTDAKTLCGPRSVTILGDLATVLSKLGKDPKLGAFNNEDTLWDARDLCRRYKRSLNRLARWGNALSHWETLLTCCAKLPRPAEAEGVAPSNMLQITRPPWPPWPPWQGYDEDEADSV